MKSGKIVFKVEILDEEIVLENGNSHAKTAVIEKWKDNYLMSSRKYGAPSVEEIYDKINKKEAINLDFCYLKDFSLAEYRKSHDLGEIDVVDIVSISASNAFFESSFGTDFSYSHFIEDPPDFSYCIFNQGHVNFGHAKCESSMNFNRSEFYLEELSFRFAEFEKGDFLPAFLIVMMCFLSILTSGVGMYLSVRPIFERVIAISSIHDSTRGMFHLTKQFFGERTLISER